MKKQLLLLLFMALYNLPFAAASNPERVAFFYFHFSDTPEDKIIAKADLQSYIFEKGQPIHNFWDANFNGRYNYTGQVFGPIKIPVTESEFNAGPNKVFFCEQLKKILGDKQQKLTVEGFDASNFDKIIYTFSEASHYSAGYYNGVYLKDFQITVNDATVKLPALSCYGMKKGDPSAHGYGLEFNSGSGVAYQPSLGFWYDRDYVILHEWGHSLGSGHASTPHRCDPMDTDCDVWGDASTCDDYHSFSCHSPESYTIEDVTYGNRFDVMGGHSYSLFFNAKLRDACGMLPDEEKVIITATKSMTRLIPYEQSGEGIRAAIIKIPGRKVMPQINLPADAGDQTATAELELYVEYRQALSFDVNLGQKDLKSNTKGLMVNLAYKNPKLPTFVWKKPNETPLTITEDFAKNEEDRLSATSWLMDMSPDNGLVSVTLNSGMEYYNDDWEITIGSIRANDAGVTFNVTYGKQAGKTTGAYPEKNTVSDTAGNLYSTATIAGKTWTTEHMNYPTAQSVYQEKTKRNGLDYTPSRFYIQSEAIQACQNLGEGWRLPSYEDFKALVRVKYPDLDMTEFISAPIAGINEIYPLGGYTGSYSLTRGKADFMISPIQALWLNDRYLFLNGQLFNSSGTGRQSTEYMLPCRCVKG